MSKKKKNRFILNILLYIILSDCGVLAIFIWGGDGPEKSGVVPSEISDRSDENILDEQIKK